MSFPYALGFLPPLPLPQLKPCWGHWERLPRDDIAQGFLAAGTCSSPKRTHPFAAFNSPALRGQALLPCPGGHASSHLQLGTLPQPGLLVTAALAVWMSGWSLQPRGKGREPSQAGGRSDMLLPAVMGLGPITAPTLQAKGKCVFLLLRI